MSEITQIAAEIRSNLGTGASRALRSNGMVPAIVYGPDKENMAIAIPEKDITKLYRKHGFTSTVIELNIDGKKHKVLPKAVYLHPIKENVDHADFVYLSKNTQKVLVPVVFEGKERSVGVKRGGFFNIIFRKLELICPVDAIPLNISIDVSNMGIGASIMSHQLKIPAGCSLSNKANVVVASITGRGSKTDNESAEGAAAAKE